MNLQILNLNYNYTSVLIHFALFWVIFRFYPKFRTFQIKYAKVKIFLLAESTISVFFNFLSWTKFQNIYENVVPFNFWAWILSMNFKQKLISFNYTSILKHVINLVIFLNLIFYTNKSFLILNCEILRTNFLKTIKLSLEHRFSKILHIFVIFSKLWTIFKNIRNCPVKFYTFTKFCLWIW